MPPKASAAEKGKGKRGAGGKDEAPLATLVARLPRGDLEALLLSYEAAVPSMRADVTAKLQPEQCKKARTERAPVGANAALVCSGPFAHLDAELHLHIFGSLDQKTKLLCVSEVCKGWRALRKEPSLWRSLVCSMREFSSSGLQAFVLGPRSPLPSPACVESLELEGGAVFDAKTFKAVLKHLSHVRTLSLAGKKLSPDAVAMLAKPRAAPLLSLTLGKTSGAVHAALLDVLAASPALTHLRFDCAVDARWVDAAGERCAAARAGGKSLLHTLHIASRFLEAVHVGALARLGAAFPELTSLTLDSIAGMEGGDCGAAWAPLPQLRHLAIEGVGQSYGARRVSGATIQALLARVVAAAPALRSLRFSRGQEYLSHTEIKAGRQFNALPSLGTNLASVLTLRHLEELKLSYFALTAADVAAAEAPALRTLELQMCGAHAAAAAAALAANAPALRTLRLQFIPRTELDGTPGPGLGGLTALASASLEELSLLPSLGDGMVDRSRSEREPREALAAAVRDLAARGACPALRSLTVALGYPADRHPAVFDAVHAWPQLQALRLDATPPEAVLASLAALRAPLLSTLSLPGIQCGVAATARPPAPAVAEAYERLRSAGHAPKLPALRVVDAAEAKPEPAADAADDGAGPADSG